MKQAKLNRALSNKSLHTAWKNLRQTFRESLARDAIDWLDIDRNIFSVIHVMQSNVKSALYHPHPVLAYTGAKSKGITRRIAVLHPLDALLYRALVDELYESMKHDEEATSFFSRTRGQRKKEVDSKETLVMEAYYERWIDVWLRLQQARKLTGLAPNTKYMVVTDISSYFDSIHHDHLRNVLARYVGDEKYLLLLRYLLETFVGRTAYECSLPIGIPQEEYDSSRVLGHLFLFFVDKHIASRKYIGTSRWMDDITISVDSLTSARVAINELQRCCVSRHIRLNEGKTKILAKSEIDEYYYFSVNQKCDDIENGLRSTDDIVRRKSIKRFAGLVARHMSSNKQGQWEQVCRRIMTIDCRLNTYFLRKNLAQLLVDHPKVGSKVGSYIIGLYSSGDFLTQISEYLCSSEAMYDDVNIMLLRAFACAPIEHKNKHIPLRAARWFAYDNGYPPMVRNEALLLMAKYGDGRDFGRLQRHFTTPGISVHPLILRTLCLIVSSIKHVKTAALEYILQRTSFSRHLDLFPFVLSILSNGYKAGVDKLGIPSKAVSGIYVIDIRKLLLLRVFSMSNDRATSDSAMAKANKWAKMCPMDTVARKLLLE